MAHLPIYLEAISPSGCAQWKRRLRDSLINSLEYGIQARYTNTKDISGVLTLRCPAEYGRHSPKRLVLIYQLSWGLGKNVFRLLVPTKGGRIPRQKEEGVAATRMGFRDRHILQSGWETTLLFKPLLDPSEKCQQPDVDAASLFSDICLTKMTFQQRERHGYYHVDLLKRVAEAR